MKYLYSLVSLLLLALPAGAQLEQRAILELENVTPRMSNSEPYEALAQVSFTVTGRWNGYPDMVLADYDSEHLATAATTAATSKNMAGVFTTANEYVAPFKSITITGNDVVVELPVLQEGSYRFKFPGHFFRSQPTADNYILTTPPMDLPYNIAKPYMPERISVVGSFNAWDLNANPLTYIEETGNWVGGFDLPGSGSYGFKFTDGETYWRANDVLFSGNTYALSQCEAGSVNGMVVSVGTDLHMDVAFQVNPMRVARFAFQTVEPEGIKEATTGHQLVAGSVVDLAGRRLARPQRGVSIAGGAKVLR